jgi:hypothetical protein
MGSNGMLEVDFWVRKADVTKGADEVDMIQMYGEKQSFIV